MDGYWRVLRDLERDSEDSVHERVVRDVHAEAERMAQDVRDVQARGTWSETVVTDLFLNADGTFTGVVSENGETRYYEGA